jgi:hypothetical protein
VSTRRSELDERTAGALSVHLRVFMGSWVGVIVASGLVSRLMDGPARWLVICVIAALAVVVLSRVENHLARLGLWSAVHAAAHVLWISGPGGLAGVGAGALGLASSVCVTVLARAGVVAAFAWMVTSLAFAGGLVRVASGTW